MINIDTHSDGEAGAVLIRAIAPLAGLPGDPRLGRGPGKVTRALGLDRSHARLDLAHSNDLFDALHATPPKLGIGPRNGVAFAGARAKRKLRFYWHGHASVTRPNA